MNKQTTLPDLAVAAGFVVLLAGTYLIYQPGLLGSFFVFDDAPSLRSLNNNGGITSLYNALAFITSGDTGPTGRPLSLASFLLDDQYWPGDPGRYRHTNLLLHLLTGVLLYTVLRQLLRLSPLGRGQRELVSLGTAALFLLHPLNSTTVLYIIQRMTILSALFVFAGLSIHLHLRQRFRSFAYYNWCQSSALGINLIAFTVLATLCKENGILLPLLVLAMEFSFAGRLPPMRFRILETIPPRYRAGLVVLVGAAMAVLALWLMRDRLTSDYEARPFSLIERLLTEATILFDYLHRILFPKIIGLSLFHDDIAVYSSLTLPVILSLIALLILAGIAIKTRKAAPVMSFAIFWYLIGHSIESTILPLELYFEHRNYLPMLGPLLALFYYCVKAAYMLQLPPVRKLIPAIPLMLILVMAPLTHQTSKAWSHDSQLFSKWAMEHPESLRANLAFAHYLADNGAHERAHKHYSQIVLQFPEAASAHVHLINSNCLNKLSTHDEMDAVINLLDNKEHFLNIEILSAMRTLAATVASGQCPDLSYNHLLALTRKLLSTPFASTSNKATSHLHNIEADIHITQGNLSGAMHALDRVFQHQPTADIPLKQAVMLASAQLYETALEKTDIALEANSKRRFLRPSRKTEIETLRERIKKAMRSQEKNNEHAK